MNGVGIDTVSLLVPLDPQTAGRIARVLPQERRSKEHAGIAHHYGNFGDWSATLHLRATTAFASAALVLTASLPRLLYGENTRPVGTLGAVEARCRLFDRLEALCGVDLRDAVMTVCRVDYCVTFAPFPRTAELLARVASVELPRRERSAMANGVTFYFANKKAKDTIYDKQAEVAHTKARLTPRPRLVTPTLGDLRATAAPFAKVTSSTAVEAELAEWIAGLNRPPILQGPAAPAFGSRREASANETASIAARIITLERAERRLRCGAVRLECRLTTGKQIAARLATTPQERAHPVPPTPERVLTTANALRVLEHFRGQLDARVKHFPAEDAATALRDALGPVQAQRAFALLVLSESLGSLTHAATALGVSDSAAARLVKAARSAGVASIDPSKGSSHSGLALPALSAARTDEFERRTQHIWPRTRATTPISQSFSLSSDG